MGANNIYATDRISFQKIHSVVEMPNLLGLQRDSYRMFLQEDTLEDERKRIGLEEVLIILWDGNLQTVRRVTPGFTQIDP